VKASPPVRTDVQAAIGRMRRSFERVEKERRSRFAVVRERIRARVLESFYRDELPRFTQLHDAFQKGCGLPVPVLSVCGHGTAEIRFTKLLAWFLDSHNSHGLGGVVCEAVFGDTFPPSMKPPSFKACTAEAEVDIGASRLKDGTTKGNSLDIMVSVEDWRLCIEQKILSPEGHNQLRNYRDRLTRRYDEDKLLLFYLTPDGRDGSDDVWIPISHGDLFVRIARVLRAKALFPTARHNLKSLLWDLMLGPIVQDEDWVRDFRRQVASVVADPERKYVSLSGWLSEYGIGQEERRVLLTLTEA